MDDKFYEELSNLINGAFDKNYGRTRRFDGADVEDALLIETPLYESIEDYIAKTGAKRFKLTKAEKSAGLTREEAVKLRTK
jgi:hypothetical protein